MKSKARYFLLVVVSSVCFCFVFWKGREQINNFRIKKQIWNDQKEINSPECMEIAKILTLKPKRFTEDDFIKLFKQLQNCKWVKNTEEQKNLRSRLQKCCNASQNFIVTQDNSPLGTNISYSAEPRRTFKITEDVVNLLPKTVPFKKLKHCSVVGNAGILANSSCGTEIDRANFVFRCNLPPLVDYKEDVGTKTDVVTSNPTIIINRFKNLNLRRKPFMDHISAYEDAFILLPAFSHSFCTSISFKVLYTLQDFGMKHQAVFLNPSYMNSVSKFWKGENLNENVLSSGLLIISAAIDMCEEVWLYGFWPFTKDMNGNKFFHHYYDNQLPSKAHKMPAEFYKLMQLHAKGIVKLHAGSCENVRN
ncbi:alpha-2,8-sialyltransferase 8F-like isoform X1 [Hemitrygon akajei]|uniref:alpha-2,8-sialyltransferase 8F-like isoform X1 n=1 Tax=Hemitrygon akajei TaxID=2704970 RepID=UPI003BF9EC1A